MSVVQAGFPENLDEILTAVRETPRGRWFLESYEKRLKSEGTAHILDSIAKLENHIQSLGTGADNGVLLRAREAIAAARRDIAAIDQKPAELSSEGQLFAKLAQLSKQSLSGQGGLSQGVERALRLVSDLDQELMPKGAATAPPAAPRPASTYFKQDEAIFEPAPATKLVVAAAKSEPAQDSPPRGAKLVIQRVNTPATGQATPTTPDPVIAEPPVLVEQTSARAQDASNAAPSRIVIIRKKADDLPEVPLLDEESAPASTAA